MLRRNTTTQTDCLVERLDDSIDFVALHAANPKRYPFLLESTASDDRLGRYDILFMATGRSIVLDGTDAEPDFLSQLDDAWAGERTEPSDSMLPFTGGWFLYLGYELAAQTEPVLDLSSDTAMPTAFAVRCPAALIREHSDGRCWLVFEGDADIDLEQVRSDIAGARRAEVPDDLATPVTHEEPAGEFLEAVRRARDYIGAGDIYQANLSRGWDTEIDDRLRPEMVYSALCETNPAPFAGLLHWQDTTVISSSPERLLSVRDGIASTRPIAGTRPRSSDPEVDTRLSAELFANAKERAEHVMLIDLERNDLGRVCEAGSVEVDEMMVLESYAHVHHIVSNVRGRLRPEVTPGEAIRAVFPGGTITGCPKVRCMQIISELEQSPRGAYTGSFGYLNRDGSLDLNIMIRTMVMRGNRIQFRAGSGIVADSEPDAELDETRAKAKGLLRALSG